MRAFFEHIQAVKPRPRAVAVTDSPGRALTQWQDVEEGRVALEDIPDAEPLNAFELAALPVSPGVSDAVQRAHDEQIERMHRTQVAAGPIRGRVSWSAQIGKFIFEPEEPIDVDALIGGASVTLKVSL
jgi:hypothetical protein